MKKICILYLLSGQVIAEEKLDDLITQVGDDSFDKREEAMYKLFTLPANYIPYLAEQATTTDSLEVEYRLWKVIRQIWENKVLTQDPRYLKIFGVIGFEWAAHIEYEANEHPEGAEIYHQNPIITQVIVTDIYPLGCAEGKLFENDTIIKVDNGPVDKFFTNFDGVEAGHVHKFTIKRDGQELDVEITIDRKEWLTDTENDRLTQLKQTSWYDFYKRIMEEIEDDEKETKD